MAYQEQNDHLSHLASRSKDVYELLEKFLPDDTVVALAQCSEIQYEKLFPALIRRLQWPFKNLHRWEQETEGKHLHHVCDARVACRNRCRIGNFKTSDIAH